MATAISAPVVTVGLSRLATVCAPAAAPASNTLSVLIADSTAVAGVFAPTTLGQVILRELEGDPTRQGYAAFKAQSDAAVVTALKAAQATIVGAPRSAAILARLPYGPNQIGPNMIRAATGN